MARGPAKAKAKAKRLLPGTSPKREGSGVRDLERPLAEALLREKATSEILRVISGSPTDVQPVFDAVAEAAARLCESFDAAIFRREGDRLLPVAHHGPIPINTPAQGSIGELFTLALDRRTVPGRAVLDGRTIDVIDLQAEVDEFPVGSELARRLGFRTSLTVPLMREGVAIGCIVLRRTEAQLFTERQVALLETFADQAVIAIENVRLFNETKEALEQQTATSQILGVISQSPTDVQPVFETIVQSAAQLCEATFAVLHRFDGQLITFDAHHGMTEQEVAGSRDRFPLPTDRGTAVGRAILDRRTTHIHDIRRDAEYRVSAWQASFQTVLAVPLLREGVPVGAIGLWRREVRPFSKKQIRLVETFADQAVIAIENVRLLTELQTSNRDLAEALEQQTATAEILGVISSSPTDVQPVFDAIAAAATTLCAAENSGVFLYDGTLIHFAAHHNWTPTDLEAIRQGFPRPPGPGTVSARAILSRAVAHTTIAAGDPAYELRGFVDQGVRTILSVPMLRDGEPIGAISVTRREAVKFTERQIALLQTFADQAVIAIENVRLFNETQESLEQQTATNEILRVISSSPTDVQPVFDVIVEQACRLCDAVVANAVRIDGDLMHNMAAFGFTPEAQAMVRRSFPQPPSRATMSGRAILERAVVEAEDASIDDVGTTSGEISRSLGGRAMISVPMLKDGIAIGAITLARREPGRFPERQVNLLRSFANQAVIAIENVRLFNETKEALEQQTATGEILRVIASSPTDIQPVLDTVAESAARLCESFDSAIWRQEGEQLRLVAHHGPIPATILPIVRGTIAGRAVLEARTLHFANAQSEGDEFPESSVNARREGWRSILSVPLMREGVATGAIVLRRTEARLFTERQVALLQTFADQAVIAIENVRLFTELQASNRELTTALDQQTATSDLLKVIGRSTFDLQPVFEMLAENAVRLCDGRHALIFRFDGQALRVVASHNISPELRAFQEQNPILPGRGSCAGRAALERRTVQIVDARSDPEYTYGSREVSPFRTLITVPMLRAGELLGAINIVRYEVLPFTGNQIALMETFADQAAIAIENVRLFTELQEKNRAVTEAHAQVSEALDQQTATAEILRVISSSPTDVQPVFDTIAEHAVRLCNGLLGGVYRFDGELIHFVAHHNWTAEGLETVQRVYPRVPSRETQVSSAILDGVVVEVRDFDAPGVPPSSVPLARALGYRSILAIPMLRQAKPIGAIAVARAETGPFSPKEIELLQTFADQAVIAIENVRLFTELQENNRALTDAHAEVTESLGQQTATSEILRVISQSQTDAQPVFDTIVQSAVRLLGGFSGVITQIVGEQLHLAALTSTNPSGDAAQKALWPKSVKEDASLHGKVITALAPHFITDVESDRSVPSIEVAVARARGYRSIVAVPLLRDGRAVGSMAVTRLAPGPFTDGQLALLQTFADQAVIAIENARLFKELEARTQDLTRSVGELRALGEVGQAISSTLDLRTVLSTIVTRATQLSGTDAGVIYEYDEQREVFVPRATAQLEAEIVETMLATPVRKGEGATGRLAEVQEPIQVPDILAAPAESRVRGALVRAGYRALLAVPLVRDDHLLGGLTVIRKATGEFAPEVIELLRTFATQSALAIQNARLFREIEEKSRQLEVASQHKSEFLANMSHELRTPLNAIIGFSEVLTERMFGELNEKQDEYLKDIYASGTHLLSLINDILDLSKIEAGRMELELTDFHLPTALDNALTLVRERAGRRSITLQTSVDERLGEVRADERKIRQVVLNLLSNAIKFTPEGGRIEVQAALKDGLVEVSVSDTGVGIAPEDQEAVFEEFRQVGTADKKVEGTGLGLALSRKFIGLHGGEIWVKSAVGAGSTFTFTIPMRPGERAE